MANAGRARRGVNLEPATARLHQLVQTEEQQAPGSKQLAFWRVRDAFAC